MHFSPFTLQSDMPVGRDSSRDFARLFAVDFHRQAAHLADDFAFIPRTDRRARSDSLVLSLLASPLGKMLPALGW